jgi:two-component system chemotaxis response regulator CheB
MGSDGAEGLLELKKAGGHTLIQDKESCVVFGMGNIAESLGAVDRIVKISQMADYIISMTSHRK